MQTRYINLILIIIFLFFNSCSKKQHSEKQIFTFQKDLEIGILEGNENYIFGAISDIDLDKNGDIYVLDPKFSRIQKYNEIGIVFPYAIDKMGRFYFAEEEDFPKVVRYVLNRKSK